MPEEEEKKKPNLCDELEELCNDKEDHTPPPETEGKQEVI